MSIVVIVTSAVINTANILGTLPSQPQNPIKRVLQRTVLLHILIPLLFLPILSSVTLLRRLPLPPIILHQNPHKPIDFDLIPGYLLEDHTVVFFKDGEVVLADYVLEETVDFFLGYCGGGKGGLG